MPITGVPLPLLSFGGTALVVTLAGIGVLAGVARASVQAVPRSAPARSSRTRGRAPARREAPAAGARGDRPPARRWGRTWAMKVVMSGGGTSGHVFPALAVAERLRDRGHDVRFVGSGVRRGSHARPRRGFPFVPVRVASAQTRISLHTAKALWMSFTAASAVRPLVRAADVVVGIGGYASAPAILAARRVRTPIVLIEQNGVPGIVNRVAARWAGAVATTFEATAERLPPGIRVVRTGNPVRRRIAEVVSERVDRRAEALRAFELDTDRRTVSVFGGSQGARQLDRTVATAIGELRGRHDLQLLVSTGAAHEGEVAPAAEASGDLLVRVEGFIERMDLALAATDLAVARAGSGTISELAVRGAVAPRALPLRHRASSGGQRPRGGARGRRRSRARGGVDADGPRAAGHGAHRRRTPTCRDVQGDARVGAPGCRRAYRGPGRGGRRMRSYAPPSGSIPTLPVPSLDGISSVHMIGVGGAGMRNLARLLLSRGIEVRGSDMKDSKGVRELVAAGADVWVGHDPERLGTPDVVIISSAIGDANPELRAARERALPVWARQQALAALVAGHRAVAVAGTHGKTTTTSMIAVVLERCGLDPSYLIGGDLNESGSGARSGGGDVFVFEADESDGSFLLARPHVGVVTNVDVDHVDFYPGGRGEIEAAFGAFVARCEHVVGCGDDPGVRSVLDEAAGAEHSATASATATTSWSPSTSSAPTARSGASAEARASRRRCGCRSTAPTTS